MSERVKPPDVIWLQYCKDGSLGQFWWAGGDVEYIQKDSASHCSPEERAVIHIATVLDGVLTPPLGTWKGTPYELIGTRFHDVVSALYAARSREAKSEEYGEDHCSQEERAVIDEAVSEFLHSKDPYWNRPRGHSFTSADGSLRDKVEQLLATRSKSEVRG